jgi:hypothetical protein
MGETTSGDHGLDAGFPQQGAVLVEVVAPVGVRPPGPATRAPPYASYRRDGVQQGQELDDIVPVAAGE